ncbi:MAG: hypothetical protein ACOC2V_05590 [Alkalispirochaeta sp.]
MISTVRTALARLGSGTLDEIRAEARCSRDEASIALDFLRSRGYVTIVSADAATPAGCTVSGASNATGCHGCPLVGACAVKPVIDLVRREPAEYRLL